LDVIAGLFELLGLFIVGNHKRHGFLINIIGNILWTFLGFKLKLYGLLLVTIPAMIINFRNWRKWRHENKLG